MNLKRNLLLGIIMFVAGILIGAITIYQLINKDTSGAYFIVFAISFSLFGLSHIIAYIRNRK